jgi:hypothetical protein
MIPGVRINGRDRVFHGALRVTVRPDIMIRSPATADERGARFHPSTNNARQCVGESLRNGNKKCSTEIAFHTAINHWPFTGCPLWCLRRPNLLSSISTVLLGRQAS